MAGLAELLVAALDTDATKRKAAEAMLAEAERNDGQSYLVGLADVLASGRESRTARQCAGLLLKHALDSQDVWTRHEQTERWTAMDHRGQQRVKQAAMCGLLCGDLDVSKAAAQAISKIARIDIPLDQWTELVPTLLELLSSSLSDMKIGFITIGYLLQELLCLHEDGTPVDVGFSRCLLTVVLQGIQHTDLTVREEATRAFVDAVLLAERTWRILDAGEVRDYLMEVLLEACRRESAEALQALVFITTMYCEQVVPYLGSFGPLMVKLIRHPAEKITMMALEWWTTILEAEPSTNLRQVLADCQALPRLTGALLETMGKRKELYALDVVDGAGGCLRLLYDLEGLREDRAAVIAWAWTTIGSRTAPPVYRTAAIRALSYLE